MSGPKLWRDASGRLTYDRFEIEVASYPSVARSVADAFGLTVDGPWVIGPDVLFGGFRRGEQLVGLEWDIWIGFMVVAKTESAEPLVREIAAWLDSGDGG